MSNCFPHAVFTMSEKKTPKEHPLANILINVVIPVLILSYLSKDPDLQERLGKVVRPWHIGPLKAMILALVMPLGYGVWHFIQTRKGNFFSALGLVSILLSGGLTLYLWNKDGSVKPNAGLLFGIKEALIPLVLGIAILTSHRIRSSEFSSTMTRYLTSQKLNRAWLRFPLKPATITFF